MDMDVPANSWVLGIPENDDQEALMLISGSKYGFRGTANTISHTLIRSSYQPDPYPELGVHEFWFAFGPVEATSDRKQIEMAQLMNNPVKYMSGTAHNGVLPLKQEFLNINEGTIAISSVKCLEDDKSEKGIVLRIYETDGKDTTCELEFSAVVENAYFVDINERPVKNTDKIDFSRKIIRFKTAANCIKSIAIILRN
jgi:alpha-mannosidase